MPGMAAGAAEPTREATRRRRVWAIVVAAVLVYEGYAFFLKEAGETSNIASAADWHLTREVAGADMLEQEMVPHADGFEGVDVWAHATSDMPQGDVRFTFVEVNIVSPVRVASVTFPASAVVARQPFHVPIPRIDVSAGHRYVLQILAADARPGHGLRFEASGPQYPEGALLVGGRQEWGDLQFRTTAERTTIYRNLRHLRQSSSLPAFARSDLFLAMMLLLFNLALAVLIWDLAFSSSSDAKSAPQSDAGTA
jgi:hypothetical protein